MKLDHGLQGTGGDNEKLSIEQSFQATTWAEVHHVDRGAVMAVVVYVFRQLLGKRRLQRRKAFPTIARCGRK